MDSSNSRKALLTCAAVCGIATAILIPVDAWMLRGVIAESGINDRSDHNLDSGGVMMVFSATAALTLLFAGIGIACVVRVIRGRTDSQ